MGVFGRLGQLSRALEASVDQVFIRHGPQRGEFDVLAALRRSGPPYTLIPSQLAAALMMSRAGMTNRLDRLEAAGLVERSLDPADRRSFRISLTEKGRQVIDAALTEHAANLARLASHLTPDDATTLTRILRTMLHALTRPPDSPAPRPAARTRLSPAGIGGQVQSHTAVAQPPPGGLAVRRSER